MTLVIALEEVGAVDHGRVTRVRDRPGGFRVAALKGWLMVGHAALVGLWRLPDDGTDQADEPDGAHAGEGTERP